MKFKYLMEDYSMANDVLEQKQKEAEDLIKNAKKTL